MKTFNPALPVETRDGRKVTILTTTANIDTGRTTDTIVALVDQRDGTQLMKSYNAEGFYIPGDVNDEDLVNVLPTTVEFINTGDSYTVFDAAKNSAPGWDVIKIVRRGDEVVSATVVTEA